MIAAMSHLRRSRRLAVLVMAWFALWLGATVASPLVGDAGLQVVCSGTSFKLVQPGQDEGSTQLSGHLGQCPACVHLAALPQPAFALRLQAVAAAGPANTQPAPPRARDAAAPPAARGPPSFS